MPFVNVRTARGLLNAQQKTELSTRLTDLMVEIEGRGRSSFREIVWILIEEHDASSWCLGGMQVSAEMVNELTGSSMTAMGRGCVKTQFSKSWW